MQDQITNENTERKSEGLEKYIWSQHKLLLSLQSLFTQEYTSRGEKREEQKKRGNPRTYSIKSHQIIRDLIYYTTWTNVILRVILVFARCN